MAAPPPTDDELVTRLAERDEAAFAQLLERHLENIRSLCWRVLASANDADDIAHNVFLKLWQKPQLYRAGKAKFSTWLYRVTLNACIDIKRRKGTPVLEVLEETIADDKPTPERALQERQRAERVMKAVAALPERQRHAIALSHYRGLSNIEAAQILKTSIEAVESLLGRARRTLKISLQHEMNELLEKDS